MPNALPDFIISTVDHDNLLEIQIDPEATFYLTSMKLYTEISENFNDRMNSLPFHDDDWEKEKEILWKEEMDNQNGLVG